MSFRKLLGLTTLCCVIATLQGCGGSASAGGTSGGNPGGPGGGGGGTGGNGAEGGNAASMIATTFSVDASTGKVVVSVPKGSLSGAPGQTPNGPKSNTMFTGNSIGFTSSVLSNDPLETGVRSLQVTLTNNTDLNLGSSSGLRIIFGPIANTTGIQSQKANTIVSTYAGSVSGYGDGSTLSAKLNALTGVAIARDGSLYVADYGNNRIRKISQGYVSTLAGSGTAAETDGVGVSASFQGPNGIAINPVDGSIIVADSAGNRIRRVTTTGSVTTVAGTGTAGSGNGPGNTATFTAPRGVAVDALGNIYVSEPTSNRIRLITLAGSPTTSANYTVSLYAGTGTAGLLDGPGAAARFNSPTGLTVDSGGNLYVADLLNNVIRRIDSSVNVSTLAGTSVASDLDGFGTGATFNHPVGVAYLNGSIFVTEQAGSVVREVVPVPGGSGSQGSWVVMSLAGQSGVIGKANGSGAAASFSNLGMLAASPSSSLFLADTGNSLVRQVIPSSGTFPIGTPSGSTSSIPVSLSNATGVVDGSDFGAAPYISCGALAPGASTTSQWNFTIPTGVTSFQFQVIVEANTDILVPLQAAVGAGSPYVDVRSLAGSPTETGFVDGIASASLFGASNFVAADQNGYVYVADQNNSAIRVISPSGVVSTIAGLASVGAGNTDGPGSLAQFNLPTGIAVAPSGTTLYVADSGNNEIRQLTTVTPGSPDPTAWTVTTVAGSATAGFADGIGVAASFNQPYAIAVDPGGLIYIAEKAGNRVRRMDPNAFKVTTIAGDNTQLAGAVGLVNGSGPGTVRFANPQGLACDAYGKVYVGDSGNNVIRMLDSAGTTSTYAGGGAGTDGAAASASFNGPAGVTMDSAGYLYVAESGNSDIRRIAPGGYVETVAGIKGVSGYVVGSGVTAKFISPVSLSVTPHGDLYVGSGANAIELIQSVVSASSPASMSRKK